jgi:hypothetical protein
MSVMTWITGKKISDEKKQLQAEMAQKVMKFERRRGEVEQVAEDVMKLMHSRSAKNEKA